MSALADLAATLREEGGLIGDATRDPAPGAEPEMGRLAAAGPRAAGRESEYALLVEAVREGYALHYGGPRVVSEDDRDLALLAGDRLYALGLDRLAALGDTEAVAELADLIALSASAEAGGRPELARAVWRAGAQAIGHGPSPAHRAAKEAAARGEDGAERALDGLVSGS